MSRSDRLILGFWLLALIVAAAVFLRAPLLTDMSVFLPSSPTPAQKLLIANIQRGESARTLLASVSPVSANQQRQVSESLTQRWRELNGVAAVSNGDLADFAGERELLFDLRYLLQDAAGKAFEAESLTSSLQRARALLASSAGLFNKNTILADPTGAGLSVLKNLNESGGPATHDGVWIDANDNGLLFVIQLSVDGADLDAQEQLLAALTEQHRQTPGQADTQLVLTGAPVFAVQSREDIRSDVILLSGLGAGLIVTLLLLMFRSLPVLLIALVPLGTAVLLGAAALAVSFGAIHALTLGFGVALIGECVDYALYQLVHRQSGKPEQAGFWSPVRLGLFTSLTGFGALLFSDFPGLAQLAVFAMVGLAAGFLTTRWVLPLLPTPAANRNRFAGLESKLNRARVGLRTLRPWAIALILTSLAIVMSHRDSLWSTDIAALNPVSAQAMALNATMQAALGGPDMSTMVLVRADLPGQDILPATQAVSNSLRSLITAGELQSIKTVTDLVPSIATQTARQQALPQAIALRTLVTELAGKTGLTDRALKPFISDIATARSRAPITVSDYAGTRLAGVIDSLLTTIDDRAAAVIPIQFNQDLPISSKQLEQKLQTQLAGHPALNTASLSVLNIKARTDELYAGYISDALRLSLAGAAAIVILLAYTLKSWRALANVTLPIVGALTLIAAGFALSGTAMHLLHLVGLLLVAAIGSNYALVLAQTSRARPEPGALSLTPLLLANLTTVAGFGVLAFSKIPLLAALGITVGCGAPLVLLLAAIASARPAK